MSVVTGGAKVTGEVPMAKAPVVPRFTFPSTIRVPPPRSESDTFEPLRAFVLVKVNEAPPSRPIDELEPTVMGPLKVVLVADPTRMAPSLSAPAVPVPVPLMVI